MAYSPSDTVEDVEGGMGSRAADSTEFCNYPSISYQWAGSLAHNPPHWPAKRADVEALSRSYFWQQRVTDLDKAGIEMWLGHFKDARVALLFPLRSVKRFAQKLFEDGKTSRVLPLPSAISSVERQKIERLERFVVSNSSEMRLMQRRVDVQNRKVNGEESMSQWGREYEEVRRLWRAEDVQATFIGLDFETHEKDSHDMLEVGWSVVGPRSQQETFHYLIEEAYNDGLQNGRYVADNRRRFLFGKVLDKPLVGKFPDWTRNGTEIVGLSEAGKRFARVLNEHRQRGPVYVVFHDSKGDMKVMDDFGIDTAQWSHALWGKGVKGKGERPMGTTSSFGGEPLLQGVEDGGGQGSNEELQPVFVLDTQLLFAAIRCGGKMEKKSLKHVCTALDVNGGRLDAFHNAANDAHYTAAALAMMAAGPHFTDMRTLVEGRLAAGEANKKIPGRQGRKGGRKKQTWSD